MKDSSFLFEDNDKWPWTAANELVVSSKSDSLIFLNLLWYKCEPLLNMSKLYKFIVDNLDKNSVREETLKRNIYLKDLVKKNPDNININLGLVNHPVLTKEERYNYWKISLKYLTEIYYLCKYKNIPVVLIVIPSGDPEFNEPEIIINNYVSELSFPLISLKEGFSKHTKLTEYPIEGH